MSQYCQAGRVLKGACSGWAVAVLMLLNVDAATAGNRWWVTGWAAPYVANEWGAPDCIFRDEASGEILMCDPVKGTVRIFDSSGIERFTFRTTVQEERSTALRRGEPRSVLVLPSGVLYLTDRLSTQVTIRNFRGDQIGELDLPADLGVEPGQLRAEQLALGPDHRIYVSTSGTAAGVAVYDDHDSLVATIGYHLQGYQKPEQPGALAVDKNGDVWLTELRGFPVVRHYDREGRYAGGFAGRDAGPRDLSFASAILCAEDGTIWVADAIRQVVKHYTTQGDLLEMIGGYGIQPGDLQYPCGLAGDGVRELYVCERTGRRIQRFYLPDAADSLTGQTDELSINSTAPGEP